LVPRAVSAPSARGQLWSKGEASAPPTCWTRPHWNTYASRYRTLARHPADVPLREDDAPAAADSRITSRELMEAIASAPAPYRDAVIAVDVLGLSYLEAARSLRTREDTIASRLHRGRQHIARELIDRDA
jgi:RNA polymerase sigma-70 factor, ECF subfamily